MFYDRKKVCNKYLIRNEIEKDRGHVNIYLSKSIFTIHEWIITLLFYMLMYLWHSINFSFSSIHFMNILSFHFIAAQRSLLEYCFIFSDAFLLLEKQQSFCWINVEGARGLFIKIFIFDVSEILNLFYFKGVITLHHLSWNCVLDNLTFIERNL